MSRKLLAKLALMMLLVASAILSVPAESEAFACYCNGRYLGEYDDVMACYNACDAT